MIKRCVYSYWNTKGESNSSGFNTFRDFLASITLSVLISKKHFEEVVFVTNSFGKKVLIDKLGLPFTDYTIELDRHKNLNKLFWAYTKIYAYSIQDKPFCHIDNDLYLWNGLPDDLKESKLCFQSIETPFESGYGWYKHLLEASKKAGYFPELIKNNPVDYSLNCGICGGNDLSLFREWIELSESYIFNPKNKAFFEDKENYLIHQNLMHEQYFISSLSNSKGLLPNKEIKLMLDYTRLYEDCYTEGRRFTHLWGLDKCKFEYIRKVYNRLEKDFPEYYNKIMKYNVVTT